MECHSDSFSCVCLLFVGEFFWRIFFERDKLGDFCMGLDVEGSGSANDDWDDLDVRFQGTMCLYCKSEGFIYIIDVIADYLDVAVSRVFAFDDL